MFPEHVKVEHWWRYRGTAALIASEFTKYLWALARRTLGFGLGRRHTWNTLRSALCTFAFYTWGVMIGTVMVPMLLLPRHWFRQFVITWSAGNGMLLRIIAGVHSEIRNREHRPTGAAIIASKHQSEWEAHVFLHELDDPAYVIKRELSFVPGYGGSRPR